MHLELRKGIDTLDHGELLLQQLRDLEIHGMRTGTSRGKEDLIGSSGLHEGACNDRRRVHCESVLRAEAEEGALELSVFHTKEKPRSIACRGDENREWTESVREEIQTD